MARNVADLLWEMLEPGDVKPALAEALAQKDDPFVVHAAKGYTLSLAKQVLNGRLDTVIKTIEQTVRPV